MKYLNEIKMGWKSNHMTHHVASKHFQTNQLQEKEYLHFQINLNLANLVYFDEVKGVFHQPLGFKNTILRGSRGRPGERSRPEYSSGDRYRIRVVR